MSLGRSNVQRSDAIDHPRQQWQATLWLLIALLTPLFVNLWVEQQFEASKVWLLRTLIWVLALLWLGGWLRGLRTKPLPAALRHLTIALSLVLILATLLSTNHYIAVYGTLDRAGGVLTQLSYLLLFGCVATRIDAPGSRQLLHAIILTAAPICLLGVAQAAGRQPLPLFTDARSPLTTTLGRANFTGAYLAMLLPLTLTAAMSVTVRWRRAAYGGLVALALVVIALSQARAAWLAAVVGIGVLFWLRAAPRWPSHVRWSSAVGGAVALGAALLLILLRGIASGGSIAARWTIWQASLRLLWPRLWLGYGADTLELHFPAVYPPQLVYYQGRGVVVDRAHNWLLDWSLNFGIVATLILIGIVYLVLRLGWQQLTRTTNANAPVGAEQPVDPGWLAACMASVCAQLVGNLFLFEVAATAVAFWLLLGVVAAATVGPERRIRSSPVSHGTGMALMVIGVLIVGWGVWQGNARPLLADVHSWRGTQALRQGNHAAALAEYSRAVEEQPQRAAYHVAAALTAAQLGDYVQANRMMLAAISLRPTDPGLYTHLAAIYAREAHESSKKIDSAYEAYEQAIALAPTIALTYRQYADLALRSGDPARALVQAQRAIDLDATDGVAYAIAGWVQLQHGDLNAAQHAFTHAVKWQPDSADFHLGLATVYLQQGNVDAARQAVQHSLTIDPAYEPSLTFQVQLQQR